MYGGGILKKIHFEFFFLNITREALKKESCDNVRGGGHFKKKGKPCKNYFSSYKLAPECRFYTQKCRKNMKNCPKLLQKVAKK